jgi:rubredoxin
MMEHEDEIERPIHWARRWRCSLCVYVNDSADKEGIHAHKMAHTHPITDWQKEQLWIDMPTGYAPPRRSGR